jgi:hypothetical protein
MKRAIGAIAMCVALFGAQPAAALTIGQIDPVPTTAATACGSCGIFQVSTGPGFPSYTVPPVGGAVAGGTVAGWGLTSWSTRGADVATKAALTVWRPTATSGLFQLVTRSPLTDIAAGSAASYPFSAAVLPGDVLGIVSGPSGFTTQYNAASNTPEVAGVTSTAAVGETAGPGGTHMTFLSNGVLLNVSAELTPEVVPAPAPVPGTHAKKCKRKKHKKAGAAKKRKCKKKHRRK